MDNLIYYYGLNIISNNRLILLEAHGLPDFGAMKGPLLPFERLKSL